MNLTSRIAHIRQIHPKNAEKLNRLLGREGLSAGPTLGFPRKASRVQLVAKKDTRPGVR